MSINFQTLIVLVVSTAFNYYLAEERFLPQDPTTFVLSIILSSLYYLIMSGKIKIPITPIPPLASLTGLSINYKILFTYKKVALLFAGISIIVFIYSMFIMLHSGGMEFYIILNIIFESLVLFTIYCTILLIEFVFDLDKTKSDKV
tara:strand:- start:89 stop:526 length:438 start_codon:yes stop_codon:yes gene_type:complete